MAEKKSPILNENKILVSFLVLEFVSSMILTAICCMKVYCGEADFGFVLAALLAAGTITILAFVNKFAITSLHGKEKIFLLFEKIMFFMNVLHLLQLLLVFVLVVAGKIHALLVQLPHFKTN